MVLTYKDCTERFGSDYMIKLEILFFCTEISIIEKKEVQVMAQATFSVRMDETLKKQFDSLCSDFGMTASTAINVFARE